GPERLLRQGSCFPPWRRLWRGPCVGNLRALMARLILQTADGQQAIDLRPVNSLGRHPNNSIQLLDKIVSKDHCIIEQRADHWVLKDLGSLNGTFVNNERVRGEAPLKHGDEISLGATKGRFDDGVTNVAPSAVPSTVPSWQS